MKNLRDIEELSAAFASNAMLESKTCVLEPDSTGIEERKISAFLVLAFFHEKTKVHRITYYPEVFPYHISKAHIEKHTRFAGNECQDHGCQCETRDDEDYRRLSVGRKRKDELYEQAVRYVMEETRDQEEALKIKGYEAFVLSVEGGHYEKCFSEGMLAVIETLGGRESFENYAVNYKAVI